MIECNQFIRNYNRSTDTESSFAPLTENMVKDKLSKLVQIKNEHEYTYYAVPLKVIHQGNQKSLILRCFDTPGKRLKQIKLGAAPHFLRMLGPLPSLNPDYLDSLEITSQDFRSPDILRVKLFPDYFTTDLIDQNMNRDVLFQKEKLGTTPEKPQPLTKEDRMKKRCKKCNFIIGDHGYYVCLKCKDFYHNNENCISDMIGPNTDCQNWVCPNCKACEVCYSKKTLKGDNMLFCSRCDRTYHTECHSLIMNRKTPIDVSKTKFVCENCARCSMCDEELASFADAKVIEDGSVVCEDCFKSKMKKEYCPVCRKKWEVNAAEMIECSCQMWIHRSCDPELTKELFNEFSTSGKVYFCPLCRKQQKNNQIIDFINILAELDEQKIFEQPVDTTAILNYKSVIEHPMDFSSMLKRARENYYIDTNAENSTYDLLLQDFNLICDNAMIFNMPKSNIHIQAKKLKKLGHYAFNWFSTLIKQPSREFLKGMRKKIGGPLKSEFNREMEEYYYDILSNEHDTNPLTKIRLVEGKKALMGPIKKNENKEIIIEITGLNFVLSDKNKEERRGTEQMQTRKQIQVEQEHILSAVKEEIINDYNNVKQESDHHVREANESKKQKLPSNALKAYNKEIFNFIDELLNVNPKNKPFYYFSPIFIQFSNPALLVEDLCYLCGSFGDREALIRCGSCSEAYHHYCVSKSYGSEEKLEQIKAMDKPWLCPKCKSCERCHKKPEFFDCLICEKCDKLFHLQCLYQNIAVVFPPYWRCEDCFRCENCGGNKVINEELFATHVDTNGFYPEFCEDFKYCYECGLKLAYCKFCRICKKYCQKCVQSSKGRNRNSKGEEIRGLQYIMPMEDSVECAKCNYYYHIACYQEDFGKLKNLDDFVCYYCKQEYENLEAFQQSTQAKSEEIRARIKTEKALLKVCEQLFKGKKSDDFERVLPAFVCENYKQLIANQCVKDMLENFKFLDPATKILTQRDSSPEPTIEPWEMIFSCWNMQTQSMIAKLELELQQDLDKEYTFKAMNASMTDVIDAHEISLNQMGSHRAIDASSYLEEIQEQLPLGGDGSYLSVPGKFLEKSGSRTFEFLNSELWTLQAAVNTCKKENERFEFGLRVPEEGSSSKDCEYLKRYSIIHPSKLSETRFDCTNQHLSKKADRSAILVTEDVSSLPLQDVFESSEPAEQVAGSLQSKEQFPFAFTQAQSNKRPTLESFKRHPNYSSYEELAKMLINEMKAIEFLRIKFYHWHSQPSVRAKFHPENAGLKFSGAIYKTPRPIFHSHSHGGATRSSQSSSNTNRAALPTSAGQNTQRTTTTEKKQDMMDVEQSNPEQPSEQQSNEPVGQQIQPQDQMEVIKEPALKASTSTSLANNYPEKNVAETADSSRQKALRSLEMMIPEINQSFDEKKEGPLDNIECICCKLQGDRVLSGRLLFVGFDQWVHANCALWSQDVYEDLEGGLINFLIAYKRGLTYICQHCYMSGATIICSSKKCQAKLHFHCAMQANCAFLNTKKFYCKNCASIKGLSNRTINDFSTKRRFYVKRNNSLFNPETTKNVKYFKELSLNLSVGGYARIGGLSILSFKRLNIETKLLFREYYAVRLVEDSLRKMREPLLILLEIGDKGYNMRFDFVDRSELTRINFLQKQLNEESVVRGSWVSIETIDKFQELMRKILNRKDFRPHFKDFMGEFLGMHHSEIRTWLKNSFVKRGDEPARVENSSFEKCFYAEDTDSMNPFDRSERVMELYSNFVQKSTKLTSAKEEERFKNPREKSFNLKVTAVKAGNRKGDTLAAALELLHEGARETEEGLIEMLPEPAKLQNIFSKELELKLKQEYLAYRKRSPKVFVAPSKIHKYGLFASENFNKNEIVIEYCGELVRNKIADKREADYRRQGFGDCFMFRIKKDTVVDASFRGNQARYLNHSCDPSCGSIIIEVDGVSHIVIYANRAIYAGEELTYDYQFDIETEKIECMCGAKNCLGRLN